MHVVLADEPTVSRNRHACITFDSEKGIFTLYVDLDRQDVFCNGVPVKGSCELENRALIQIGECVLSFMAFCDSVISADYEVIGAFTQTRNDSS